MRRAAVIVALLALLAAGSAVGTSRAAFTAHEEFAGTVAAAADWVGPAVTLSAPADDSYQRTTSVTLSGAAGSLSGDSTTVTVNIYAGASATGSPVVTRSVTRSGAAWSTTVTALSPGAYTAQATQSDSGGNTGTSAARRFTIDTVAPTRVSMTAENGSGTAGHLDAGDKITFTYSEPMLASSILPTWSGTSAATVKVRFFKVSGTVDGFTVLDGSSQAGVALDSGSTSTAGVTLGSGADFVSGQVTFTASMTRSDDGRSFVIVLGSNDNPSKIQSSRASGANMTWKPSADATDLAGNALAGTASWTESGSGRDF